MTGPGPARHLEATVLDEGRERLLPPRVPGGHRMLDETVLDEGRRRPDPDALFAWPDDGSLPQELAERYERGDPTHDVTTGQSRLLHVRVKATGNEAMVKHCLVPRIRRPELEAYLSAPHGHAVRYLEFGPDYEVMEYLPGGSLAQRRNEAPAEFGYAGLHSLVHQLAAALIDLHRQGIVHRDLKPANVVLRTADSLEAALVDFGRAGPPGDGVAPVEGSNPAYQPPEWVLRRRLTEAYDWWALGMTVVELTSGQHPFVGLDAEDIRDHFGSSRRVDVSGVPDDPSPGPSGRRDRLRRLCQGLLALDRAERWGAQEVGQWLVGADPDLPNEPARTADPAAGRPAGADTAFMFRGAQYRHRDDLALAFSTAWNHAVEVLFGSHGRLEELRAWLDQFTDDEGVAARRTFADECMAADRPGRVRLLFVVLALDPTRPSVYRNHVITRSNLRAIAHRAVDGDGDDASVLQDLWYYHLLPRFDAALPPPDEDNPLRGYALADLDRDWRLERRRWDEWTAQVRDRSALDYLEHSVRPQTVLAICLRAALRDENDTDAAHRAVQGAANALPAAVPWFSTLARRPELVWLALLLAGHARSQAASAEARRITCGAAEEAVRISARFREWSRRQNRPSALGWAAAGVSLLAVLTVALITGGDLAGRVDDTAIDIAWVEAAVGLAVSLAAECLIAVHVGGRFHNRYSIPGAGRIALAPVGRWMQRRSLLAFGVIVGGAVAIALVTAAWPQAVPLGVTAAHLLWVQRRWRAWDANVEAEDARIREAALRGPSGTDDTPIGTTIGANA